ncbi:MAG: hypothetical protein AAGF26_13595 [Cyanobacteria bacterium P01_G01_bin.49]
MNNPVTTVLTPPTPPQLKLSVADRLASLRVMSEELDAGVKYCEDSIEYYKKIIEQFESRLAKEKELLELTKNTVASLSEFVTASPAEIKPEAETLTTTKVNVNGNGKAKANGNGKVATIELEQATKTKSSKTKIKAKTKSSRAKTRTQAKAKTKTNTKKKVAPKSKSTLPPSERLEGSRSLNSAVLDFMRGKNEVVSVKDIIRSLERAWSSKKILARTMEFFRASLTIGKLPARDRLYIQTSTAMTGFFSRSHPFFITLTTMTKHINAIGFIKTPSPFSKFLRA